MKIQDWYNITFKSSIEKTQQFKDFAKDFWKEIKKQTKDNFDIVGKNNGHFYISGFLQNKNNNKYFYFNVPDVRFNKNWYLKILIRTAKNKKDYSGGQNILVKIEDFGKGLKKLS